MTSKLRVQTNMTLAARAHLLAIVIATTGETEIAATANGYVRHGGSFHEDGFVPGLEITPVGFPVNPVDVVTWISEDGTELRTLNAHAAVASDEERTIKAVVPRQFQRGTKKLDMDVHKPYWKDRMLGGPSLGRTSFSRGNRRTVTEPLYEITVCGRAVDDDLVAQVVADAIADHFGSGTALAVTGSDEAMTLQGTPLAPIGPIGRTDDGRPQVVVTIPLRLFHRR